jgi:methyl-accepting chemotaxis protein
LGLDNLDASVIIANEMRDVVYVNHSAKNFLKCAEIEIRKDLPNFEASSVLGKKIEYFHKNPTDQKTD